jgi:hypothetical protein
MQLSANDLQLKHHNTHGPLQHFFHKKINIMAHGKFVNLHLSNMDENSATTMPTLYNLM